MKALIICLFAFALYAVAQIVPDPNFAQAMIDFTRDAGGQHVSFVRYPIGDHAFHIQLPEFK